MFEINTICWFTDVINFFKWAFWILPFVKMWYAALKMEKNKGPVQTQQLKGRRKRKQKKKKGNRHWIEATGTLGALSV